MNIDQGIAAWRHGDHAAAYAIFKPLAENGNAYAQFCLGYLYRQGKAVPQDMAMAVAWYEKAAAQGEPAAQQNLGLHYQYAWGVPQDFDRAAHYHELAAQNGDSEAALSLNVLRKLRPLLPLLMKPSRGDLSSIILVLKQQNSQLITTAGSPNETVCRVMVQYEWMRDIVDSPVIEEAERLKLGFTTKAFASTYQGCNILPRLINILSPLREVPVPQMPGYDPPKRATPTMDQKTIFDALDNVALRKEDSGTKFGVLRGYLAWATFEALERDDLQTAVAMADMFIKNETATVRADQGREMTYGQFRRELLRFMSRYDWRLPRTGR